jgi:2-methylcitrate dehydratase PrpD
MQYSLAAAVTPTLPGIARAQSADGEAPFDPDAVLFTKVLSEFVVRSAHEQLPGKVVTAAKWGMVDTLGVTLAAVPEDVSIIVRRYAREKTSRGEATVIGGGFKTNADLAAFANGTMAHALDYDNVIHIGTFMMGHPSVVIFPAVLAVAEQHDLAGKDLILAYAVGLEVYSKVALLCGSKPDDDGWHNTPFIGTMAAAGAVARLLNLDVVQTERCFGAAASSAGGLKQNFGTMTKPLHAGNAARNGIEAAELAKMGLTANEHIFESPSGFRNTFLGTPGTAIKDRIPYGSDTVTLDEFAARLGNPWNIGTPGMTYKICPSCRSSH